MNQYKVKVDYDYDDNNGIVFSSSVYYFNSAENENDAISNIQNIINENDTIVQLRYNDITYQKNKNSGIASSATQVDIILSI
jgi:hypothetical protein